MSVIKERLLGTSHRFKTLDRVVTVPNIVTAGGICMVVLYLQVLLTGKWLVAIPVILAVAVLSDLLDGLLADKLDQHSRVGKVLDPARDRLLTAVILYNLWIISDHVLIHILIVGTLLAELVVVLVHGHKRLVDGVNTSVHAIGKARCAVQWAVVFVLFIGHYWFGAGSPPFIIATTGVVFGSSFTAAAYYVVRFTIGGHKE